MKRTAKQLASYGRYGDTELLHVNKEELAALRGIGSLAGTRMTTNPTTGLPEAFNFGKLLPSIIGLGATVLSGGTLSPLTAGLISGAATTAATGDIRQGLIGGITGGAAAGLGQGIVGMGQGAATAAQGAGAEIGSGMMGAGLDGVAGDAAASTFATGGMDAATNAGVSAGLDGVAGDAANAYGQMGSGLDGMAGDAAGTFATNPNTFSMENLQNNMGNPDAWSQQFMGDKFMSRTAPGLMAVGSNVSAAMMPEPPGKSEEDKRSEEFAKKEKFMTRKVNTPGPGDHGGLSGSEFKYFDDPVYNFAGGGVAGLPNQMQDSATLKAVRAIRGRYRSKKAAMEDMGVQGSFMQRLGITDPNDPILQYAFGYTSKQGKKKESGGGIMALAGGGHIKGAGDGMSDSVPATIEGKQPARLARDEFVFPADAVSGLGNGSSEAGAEQLKAMVARIRAARTGTAKQAPAIDPRKVMPV